MENADEPITPTNGAAAKLPPITVLLLTYNEEKHLGRAIESVRPFAAQVVVDSFSTDGTVAIARALGAAVLQNPWENNHARNGGSSRAAPPQGCVARQREAQKAWIAAPLRISQRRKTE